MASQAVSKWERGTALPDITLLPYLADCFEVTIHELMDYELKTLTYKGRFVKFMVSNGILNFRGVKLKSGVYANYYLNAENLIKPRYQE